MKSNIVKKLLYLYIGFITNACFFLYAEEQKNESLNHVHISKYLNFEAEHKSPVEGEINTRTNDYNCIALEGSKSFKVDSLLRYAFWSGKGEVSLSPVSRKSAAKKEQEATVGKPQQILSNYGAKLTIGIDY